ncbi:hypothetical protein DL762_000589 [Monosporascus cannonballus]|uniref:Uncharacterized protein n=1 Tax=Monosporascus cannonballus TaxID=155416 RepID=A0ABY0HL64_9PEZI|nr:hypothetical protein DL762_000589 [Monosporascus cannonballus]
MPHKPQQKNNHNHHRYNSTGGPQNRSTKKRTTTPTPNSNDHKNGIVKKVFGTIRKHNKRRTEGTADSSTLLKEKRAAATLEHWAANYELSHWPDRPRGGGSNDRRPTDGECEQELAQIWESNETYRNNNRLEAAAMKQQRQSEDHPRFKSRPNPPLRQQQQQPQPLTPRTPTPGREGSSVATNYAYPLCSPRSNRGENALMPPWGLWRGSHDSSRRGDDTYGSDDSSAISPSAMTTNVYRSASLAGAGVGRGASGWEAPGRGKPTNLRTPYDVQDQGRDYFGGEGAVALSRKASSRDKSKSRSHKRKSIKVVHRRRQTRYARPSIRGARASPTSTYYDSLNIHHPIATPGLLASLAYGGSDGIPQEPVTPFSSNAAFAADSQKCPMPGCTGNKAVLPVSGLCEDCVSEFRPRESTFAMRISRPPIEEGKLGAMFRSIDNLRRVEIDKPADRVVSKFSPNFSPPLNTNFKLQPPPRRKASKRNSAGSSGSDKSHVGFQIALPKTPEPKQRRFTEEYIVEYPDRGSATSRGTWESYYSQDSCDGPTLSVKSLDPADSPSVRRSQPKHTWSSGSAPDGAPTYGNVVDIFDEFEDDTVQDYDEDDIYTEIHDIIDEYLKVDELDETANELMKEEEIVSFSETVAEIDEAIRTFKQQTLEDTAPHREGVPKRAKAVKKHRNTGGLKGSEVVVSSQTGPNEAEEPEKHPSWDWI